MPFDVFISHASQDRIIANAVCARLEAAGIRCWIAPRDIVAGTSYGEAIIEAIHASRVMVLVFSSSTNSSAQIPKEVERAVSNGVAILPFRIEEVAPGKSLDFFISSVHWLDAMTPPMEKHLDELAETVRKLLPWPAAGQSTGSIAAQKPFRQNASGPALVPSQPSPEQFARADETFDDRLQDDERLRAGSRTAALEQLASVAPTPAQTNPAPRALETPVPILSSTSPVALAPPPLPQPREMPPQAIPPQAMPPQHAMAMPGVYELPPGAIPYAVAVSPPPPDKKSGTIWTVIIVAALVGVAYFYSRPPVKPNPPQPPPSSALVSQQAFDAHWQAVNEYIQISNGKWTNNANVAVQSSTLECDQYDANGNDLVQMQTTLNGPVQAGGVDTFNMFQMGAVTVNLNRVTCTITGVTPAN